MGLQPIFMRLHCFQCEQNRKRHRSDETDAWCKRALKTILNRSRNKLFKEEYQVPSDILDFPYIDLDYVFLILVSA